MFKSHIRIRKIGVVLALAAMLLSAAGCSGRENGKETDKEVTIAATGSLSAEATLPGTHEDTKSEGVSGEEENLQEDNSNAKEPQKDSSSAEDAQENSPNIEESQEGNSNVEEPQKDSSSAKKLQEGNSNAEESQEDSSNAEESQEDSASVKESQEDNSNAEESQEDSSRLEESQEGSSNAVYTVQNVALTEELTYAEFSEIHSDSAVLYINESDARNGVTVCVNAGHGTKGGTGVKTYCHPDKSPKVTGGSTAKGAEKASAVSTGMTFADGTPEAKVTLACAKLLRDRLLEKGYSVLMIRESDDVQLDNVARTVLANHYADCHIALHWDSSESDKGAFYISVPDVDSYRQMEPVASTWEKTHLFGDSLIAGLRNRNIKLYGKGSMAIDLTQTSYSSIPSIDMELGDKKSDHSEEALSGLADGMADGVDLFFGFDL